MEPPERPDSPSKHNDSSDGNNITLDSIFSLIGEFGRYQKRVYLLLCLPVICCAMHILAWVFLGAKVDYRCRLPIEFENATFDILPNNISVDKVYPWDLAKNGWSGCERLIVDFTDNEYFVSGDTSAKESVKCEAEYVFDTAKYQSSAFIDYELICEKTQLYTLANTLFMLGVLLGSIVFGELSDRIGRRPVFFLALVLQTTFGILAGAVTNYVFFVIARLIVGMSISGILLVGFVIAMEMVGPSKRMVVGTVWQFFFTAGYLAIIPFAYFITNWQYLQIALSVPGLIFLTYYWFLPESIRWMLSHGRRDEAIKLLAKVAQENQTTISHDVYRNLTDENRGNTLGILEIFRYPKLRIKSLIIFCSWFVNCGVYYGLSLNTSNLGGNDYLNFAISGAVEIPANTFLLLSLNRWGRKIILCGCMLSGGIFMIVCGFIPSDGDWDWLLVTCTMIGKMFITASSIAIYVVSAESFPTVIRSAGVGAGSMFARVGGILQGYVLMLGDYWKPLPMVVFGVASLLSGLLGLFIPETFGMRLPESLEDGENYGPKHYKTSNTFLEPKNESNS